MAKKERNTEVDVEFARELEKPVEAEMYRPPKAESDTDATVMKQVGVGGPVPIIAPKHNTIQLQPIIVPLAVVPYMTQDSNVLRTDGKQAGGYVPNDEYGEDTQFESVSGSKKKGKEKAGRGGRGVQWQRIFAVIMFVVAAFLLLPFLISYSSDHIGNLQLTEMNFIGMIKHWVEAKSITITSPEDLVYIAVPVFTAAILVTAAICLISGRFNGLPIAILSFIDIACLVVLLVWNIVEHRFVASAKVAFIIALVESIIVFVLAVVFNIISNHIEDSSEQREKYGKEI
ncbi:MAG: hypothetical protein K2J16_06535 [Clostridia bacterium]|nr:hypothetical protein [Clostridia bacterium]